MAIAKTNFFSKFLIRLIVGASVSWGICSTVKVVVAETSIVLTDSIILSVDFNECKSRASKAANFLLKEVKISEERNLRYRVTGTSKETVVVIYCIERSPGTIAIITTSTYSQQNQGEASSIYDRLTNFMIKGS